MEPRRGAKRARVAGARGHRPPGARARRRAPGRPQHDPSASRGAAAPGGGPTATRHGRPHADRQRRRAPRHARPRLPGAPADGEHRLRRPDAGRRRRLRRPRGGRGRPARDDRSRRRGSMRGGGADRRRDHGAHGRGVRTARPLRHARLFPASPDAPPRRRPRRSAPVGQHEARRGRGVLQGLPAALDARGPGRPPCRAGLPGAAAQPARGRAGVRRRRRRGPEAPGPEPARRAARRAGHAVPARPRRGDGWPVGGPGPPPSCHRPGRSWADRGAS